MEAFGQRDEPAMIGFGEALEFQTKVGRRGHRAARTGADARADRGAAADRRRQDLDASTIRRDRRRSCRSSPAALDVRKLSPGALPEGSHRLRDARRPGPCRGCDSRRISTTRTPTSTAPWTPSRATCARACDRSHVVSGFRPDQCSVRLYPDPEPRIPATIAVRRGPVAARAAGIGRWPDPTGSSLRSRQAHRGRSDRSRGRPAARIRRPPAPRASARHAVG